jgi:hypothetical protein
MAMAQWRKKNAAPNGHIRRGRGRVAGPALMTLTVLAAVVAAGSVGAGAADVPATVQTFTWTGTAAGSGTSTSWSDPANWLGGVAPASGATVNLIFPVLSCGSSPCGTSSNDLTGLNVASFALHLAQSPTSPVPDQYAISGNRITVDGLTVKTAAGSAGESGALGAIGLPITVAHSQTWTIGLDNNSQPAFSAITGLGNLTISSSGSGFVDLEAPVNVGTLSFVGSGGWVAPFASLNSNGHSVNVTGEGFFSPFSIALGPFTTSGSQVQFGNGGGNPPYAKDVVKGNAVFDSASHVQFLSLAPGSVTPTKPVAGTDYTQLKASGSVTLGSAGLTVFAHCGLPLGAVYTIVRGVSGLSGTFAGTPDGAIAQAQPDGSSSCAGTAVAPWLKYHYNDVSGIFTAKVVSPPPAGTAVTAPAAVPYYVAAGGQVTVVK